MIVTQLEMNKEGIGSMRSTKLFAMGVLVFGTSTIVSQILFAQAAGEPNSHYTLRSPDGRVTVSADLGADGALSYGVALDGNEIISPSPIGLSLYASRPDEAAAGDISHGLHILAADRRTGEDAYTPVNDKVASVRDGYSETTVHLEQQGGARRKLDVILRAYNQGAAFRVVLPPQSNLSEVRIAGETSMFAFPRNYACMGLNLDRYHNSHEGEFDPIKARYIRPAALYELPLVCQTDFGTSAFALAESGIEHYSAAYLSGRGDGSLGVEINLTPRVDDERLAVATPMTPDGVKTPWRVIMIADRPEKLLESNLVDDLAAPSRLEDTSWIVPGKASWDWWSGPSIPGMANVGANNATYKVFIDFASRLGFSYMLIDDGWAKGSGGGGYVRPDSDITKTAPGVDLPELVTYARERHVGLWLWANWQAMDKQMDQALPLYEKLGIKGIKVDFMDRQDQAMVEYYYRLLDQAAKHHLMVDLHGAFTPRGIKRTYPNFLTQEGVMGAEYNKWSARVTATHNVSLAYTRDLLGPMDYTPGGFRNVAPANFVPRNIGPEVMTTRAQQLALYVVYTSPFACVSDTPSAYETADQKLVPGADFLKRVPTTWDETRALAGEFGQFIVVARRKGKEWYVGAINDETARQIRIPLNFLGAGHWTLSRWTDGNKPAAVTTGEETIDGGGSFDLDLASSGGAALILTPQ
jgi:alpha-glucosidase